MSRAIVQGILSLAELIYDHVAYIVMAYIATLLIIFGNDMNRLIKKRISHYPFFLRLTIFMLIAAFGYGSLTVWLTQYAVDFFYDISPLYLPFVVFGLFLILGVLAERKNYL